MKWYTQLLISFTGTLLALAVAAGVAYWRFMIWFNTPLGEPMHLDFGAETKALPALGGDYQLFWIILFGVVLVAFAAIGIWIAIELRRIADR